MPIKNAHKPNNPNPAQKNSGKQYHCMLHGHNRTHDMKDCNFLNKHKSEGNTGPKNFSQKKFRKELTKNMAKGPSKQAVLDSYAAVINGEHAKMHAGSKKPASKPKQMEDVSESSESEHSIQIVQRPDTKPGAKRKRITEDDMEAEIAEMDSKLNKLGQQDDENSSEDSM